MGEKVSEAPEPVPRGCGGPGARTLAAAAAPASPLGASSAESSSGSETLSEEGEPGGGFSRESRPPQPPGGALGARPPAAWAPARVLLELGIPPLPLPPPGGAAPPAPRGSCVSQEEQDEEVRPPSPPRAAGHPSSLSCAARWSGEGPGARALSLPGVGGPPGCQLRVCVCARVYMCF